MIATLALAASLQAVPEDEFRDQYGCRWKRKPAATKPVRPAKAASAPLFSKPKAKKPAPAASQPEDAEFIGCDPEGFPVLRSDLETVEFWPEEVPPTSDRLPDPEPALPSPGTPPATFEEGCDCRGPTYPPGSPSWPGGGGGGYIPPITPPVVAPIPEFPVWLLMLAGLPFIRRRTR